MRMKTRISNVFNVFAGVGRMGVMRIEGIDVHARDRSKSEGLLSREIANDSIH